MILKRPYIIFVKFFKLIHILLSSFIILLIYKTSKIVNFFGIYLDSTSNVVGEELKRKFFSISMFIIPIVLIIISIIILSILFKKNKPYSFYMFNIFAFIAILVGYCYCYSFLGNMEVSIMNIKSVKLTRDLMVLSILLESFSFLFLLTRGLGLNFKKFDFSSDLIKLDNTDRNDSDFELDMNFDLNEKRRQFRRGLRYFKYAYKENKFLIRVIFVFFVCVICFIVFGKGIYDKSYKEGNILAISGINFGIDKSYVIEKDKSFIVAIVIKTNSLSNKKLYLKDLVLNIGDYKFISNNTYCDEFGDFGECYTEQNLSSNFNNYVVVFELPIKFIKSDFELNYITVDGTVKFKINPDYVKDDKSEYIYKLGEDIKFVEDALKDISFNIYNYVLGTRFQILYNYCIDKNNCISSKEYLTPTADMNFDKIILKLNNSYTSSNKSYNTFYKLFNAFGSIEYRINGKTYVQSANFKEVKGNRYNISDVTYIEIMEQIYAADSISLVFNTNNNKYVYKLLEV